jgi:hypothetical protein
VYLHHDKHSEILRGGRDVDQSSDHGQQVSDGANPSQFDEWGPEGHELVIQTSTSEIVNNFFEDLEDLLSERVVSDLDDAVVALVVLVFLPRGGSRGANDVTAGRETSANGTQARVGSKRGSRWRRRRRQATVLNLCCQCPGKDWV